MRWSLILAMLITTAGCCVYAQDIGSIEHQRNRRMKFENGLIVSWSVLSENASLNQVDIFDDHGSPVTSLNALRPVQDAQSVSISDVSARSGRLIAVAAVYASKEGNQRVRPAAALLLFDFSGRLLSAFALQPWRQISRLVVDEASNVWTLAAHADDKDPSTVPLLVEYKATGVIAKELLARSMFPLHASSTEQNAMIGSPSMGYDAVCGSGFRVQQNWLRFR
jgi:hypothetical protein